MDCQSNSNHTTAAEAVTVTVTIKKWSVNRYDVADVEDFT